ncbi:helix-turn-helix transcriptional regulator [Dictyobacter aurantiacus]|uniref:HTH cro/C1-type domain-containing protein n=1 Tax=Dictyobacter aurantiacus TaxID=1936993 RepID=A0A401Z921_9CHLR|nr:helix-turn-helix transcriptional regulator [Dictyobacter aurantiacus]GCE03360.1 hypothetical protein KDAU_06890 [Dictyobacter aurantiacus]
MRQSFGEYLRLLRRQQGLTQSELGADQFSKSYVSAVERNSIIPSHSALLHFAEKLEQAPEDFERHLQDAETKNQYFPQPVSPVQQEEDDQEIISLLDMVLKGQQKIPFSLPTQLRSSSLFSSSQGLTWQERQARLLFLNGLVLQEDGEFARARAPLEQALALATSDYHPFISNVLGNNYAREYDYISALRYHQRALTLLKEHNPANEDLLQQVAYRCGDDCRALSYHVKACLYFEEANRYLQSTSNLASAGKLYLGWGYCIYAALPQASPHRLEAEKDLSTAEIEQGFHQAVTYLSQSCSLYQISSDIVGEMHARLMQTMILIDWGYWNASVFAGILLSNEHSVGSSIPSRPLDDAYEQCRKIFLKLMERYEAKAEFPADMRQTATTALAYLIHVTAWRAMLARLNKHSSIADKERRLAVCMCEWVLCFLNDPDVAWDVIRCCAHISDNDVQDCNRSFDLAQTFEHIKDSLTDDTATLADICFAFGILAEEIALAEVDGKSSDQLKRFDLADHCFHVALTTASRIVPNQDLDASYLLRLYLRYATILEQRMHSVQNNQAIATQALLMVKKAFASFPGVFMSSLLEAIAQ